MRAASSKRFTNGSETGPIFSEPWPLIYLADTGRESGWWIVFRKVNCGHSDQARMSEGEPESERLDSLPLSRERRKGHFSDERSSHSEKSLGVSSEKFTSF